MTHDLSKLVFNLPPTPKLPIRNDNKYYPIYRIFCVGQNYAAHAREMGSDPDRQPPFYFSKLPSSVVMSGQRIAYPPATQNFHYEIELVVAIGKTGFRIPKEDALNIVYGYACGLDMTKRDLQHQARNAGLPWDIAKGFEQAAIIGEISKVTEIGHIQQGSISLKVNNIIKQQGDIADLIWSVAEIISDLSKYYHLQPGDLIYTGTPAGVGAVKPGDNITGHITGLSDITLSIGEAE